MTAVIPDRNPLDLWASGRTGIAAESLTRDAIADYQLRAIRETVAWVRRRSPFYAARLTTSAADWPCSLEEFSRTPFTGPADVVDRAHEFLCVPQSEISRVVTMESSGTSGARKRILFTAADQDSALDFFAHGVRSMAREGDRMLIGLPGEREGSVGFELARGIARAAVVAIPHGPIVDPAAAIARMDEERATLAIGLPVQMLAIALEASEASRRVFRRLHTMVLCGEPVPQGLADRIRETIGCEVYEHYGSTEMGLGGGVDCSVHAGYHLREADLYFEIVSPETGETLAEGETGEVVFTTLGRHGMPLLRYRTGDLSRILSGPCACGSPLRRLARVQYRIDSEVKLGRHGSIRIADLDEALFAVSAVHDFSALLAVGTPHELQLQVQTRRSSENVAIRIECALMEVPAIAANCAAGDLRLRISLQKEPFPITGAKRKIGVKMS